jgi:beta-galactosidase GanA
MSFRVTLNADSKICLEQMIEVIKTERPESLLTPSELADWIIKKFQEKFFRKHLDQIANDHFNIKAFTRTKVSQLNSLNDFENLYKEIKEKMKTPERK